VELASSCRFAELHSLVDELHCRRQENGTSLADYGYQAQLKALIHLVHHYGDCRIGEEEPDFRLIVALKKASVHLREMRPQGLLGSVLARLHASWPELLAIFGVLLAEEGDRLASVRNYVQVQHLLYFFYTSRIAQGAAGKSKPNWVLDEDELRRLGTNSTLLGKGWAKGVPLLFLEHKKFLLSPELLYDDLLQRYLELAITYHAQGSASPGLRVAEDS